MGEIRLGIRALNVMRNHGIETPADLDAKAAEAGVPVSMFLLRTPNCGRKTLIEITEWYNAGKPFPFPSVVWVRIDKDVDGSWRVFSVSNHPRTEPTWFMARVEQPDHAQEEHAHGSA